jgi:hypothetical protein
LVGVGVGTYLLIDGSGSASDGNSFTGTLQFPSAGGLGGGALGGTRPLGGTTF